MYQALCRLPDATTSILADQYHSRAAFRQFSYKLALKVTAGKRGLLEQLKARDLRSCLNLSQRDLMARDLDFIIAPVASDLIYQLDLPDAMPLVYITDATPKFIQETYNSSTHSDQEQRERISIQKASRVVFSSHYMAERAQDEFADILADQPQKVCVIPFGLNLDSVPQTLSPKKMEGPLRLLFVGKEWERKGGVIALETLDCLRQAGVNAQLTIIGCDPEAARGREHVTVIPFLNKNKPQEQQRYFDLLRESHFLLLPTRADCTPMVIAEANALGMPVLVSDVGGIGTLVRPGLNGSLFSLSAAGAEYARVAAEIFADSERYQQLSKTSRGEYETRLNWDAWAQQMYQLGSQLCASEDAMPQATLA